LFCGPPVSGLEKIQSIIAARDSAEMRLEQAMRERGEARTEAQMLKGHNSTLQVENSTLQADNTTLRGANTTLRAEMGNLQAQLHSVTGHRDLLQRDMTTLMGYPVVQQIVQSIKENEQNTHVLPVHSASVQGAATLASKLARPKRAADANNGADSKRNANQLDKRYDQAASFMRSLVPDP